MWKALLWLVFLAAIVWVVLNAPLNGASGATGLAANAGSGMTTVSTQVLDEIVKMALPFLKGVGMAALKTQ